MTEETPEVIVDFDKGVIEISGSSLPEDSVAFYHPILEVVKEYIENSKPKTVVNLNIKYLNSSSQKRMMELVSLLHVYHKQGNEIEVNWYYPEDDEDILDEGKDFAKLIALPMNFIPVTKRCV